MRNQWILAVILSVFVTTTIAANNEGRKKTFIPGGNYVK